MPATKKSGSNKKSNAKAKKILKWKPKISFKSLVNEMVINDINLIYKQS